MKCITIMDEIVENATQNQNYCRLCAQVKEHLTCIFDKEDLSENIDQYLGIQILKEDILPLKMCDTCEIEVTRTIQHIISIKKSQDKLFKIFKIGRSQIIVDYIKSEDPLQFEIETETEVDPYEFVDLNSDALNHQNNVEFFKTAETKEELDPRTADLHSDVKNPIKDLMFTMTVPGLPLTDNVNGKPNSSISIMIDPNLNQWSKLQALGRKNLKKFGKELFKTYGERVMQEVHLKLTFTEIENYLNCFRKSLGMVEDPVLQDNNMDHQVKKSGSMTPEILMKPLEVTFNTASDLNDGPTNTRNGSTTASVVSPKFITCHLCPFTTAQKFRLTQHHKEVHEKLFPCNECDKRYGKEIKLLLHKKTEHTDLPSPIICSLCSMSFMQRYHYKQHLKTHSNNDSSWFCDYCKENFSYQYKLDLHIAKFHKKTSVKCSQCTYVAAHKYQIKQHIREVHLKSIICAECGKRESKKCRMEAHIRNNHLPKRIYECESCFTKYVSKKWFEIHKRKCHRQKRMSRNFTNSESGSHKCTASYIDSNN